MITVFQTLIQFFTNILQEVVELCHRNVLLQFSLVSSVIGLVVSVFSILWKRK